MNILYYYNVSGRNLLWIFFNCFTKRDVTVIILNAPGDLADGRGNEGLVVSTPAVRVLTRHVSVGYRQHQHQRPPLANHLQTIDSFIILCIGYRFRLKEVYKKLITIIII